MTDEALNILNDEPSITLELELYKDENGDDFIYISNENSSGCKYPVRTAEEIGKRVTEYFKNYVL